LPEGERTQQELADEAKREAVALSAGFVIVALIILVIAIALLPI